MLGWVIDADLVGAVAVPIAGDRDVGGVRAVFNGFPGRAADIVIGAEVELLRVGVIDANLVDAVVVPVPTDGSHGGVTKGTLPVCRGMSQ